MLCVDQVKEYERPNPYAPRAGEVLLEGTFRNSQGLLVRECQKVPESALDLDFLQKEMTHLRKHVIIMLFVDSNPNLHTGWLNELQSEIKPGRIVLHKEVGCGYLYIRTDCEETTRRILGMSPHRLQAGTTLFYNWVPAFNPSKPVGLIVPVWISLRRIPLEYLDYARQLASQVGTVIGEDNRTSVNDDPRFCIALDVQEKFWLSKLIVPNIEGKTAQISIDYEDDQVKCKHCLDHFYLSARCPMLRRWPQKQISSEDERFTTSNGYMRGKGDQSRYQNTKYHRNHRSKYLEPQTRRELEEGGFCVVEGKRRNQGYHNHQQGNSQRQYRNLSVPTQSSYRNRDVIMTDRSSTPPHKEVTPAPIPQQVLSPPYHPPSPTPPPPSQAEPRAYQMPPMPTQVLLEDQILEQMDLEFGLETTGGTHIQDTIGDTQDMSKQTANSSEMYKRDLIVGQPSVESSSPKYRAKIGQASTMSMELATLMLELLGISTTLPHNNFYFNPGTTEEESSEPQAGSEQFQDA
jgi:hypothetical protein